MQTSPEIIEFLNEALRAELAAINQYFTHSKMCENWGWGKLAAKFRAESVEEMHDAEKIMDRILLLGGQPNPEKIGTVNIGRTVPEQLESDMNLEIAAIERYGRGIELAKEHGDVGTYEMLEGLLVAEEQHLDWITTQRGIIDEIGLELYLLSQTGD